MRAEGAGGRQGEEEGAESTAPGSWRADSGAGVRGL